MISVSNLAKSFGPQVLFEGVSFQLNPGCRYGLVGANGSGKSTLLRILTGDELPSDGQVSMPKRLRLGVLRQDHFRYETVPILDVVVMGNEELWKAMEAKEALLADADRDFDAERYAELEELILAHDGYAVESRAGEILEGLGIPAEQHRLPLSTLSGGFKLRVLLAQALAASPECLLLDEPTNHLDILSIRWLEKFLVEFPGLVVVISHDHRFIDNVSTHVLDVDYESVSLYPGNYTAFLEQKAGERDSKEAENAKREKKIADHQAFVDRFRAKATKARQAQSKMKLMEKMSDELVPLAQSSRRYPTFRFPTRRPSGRMVLELEGVSKAFGERKVLEDVSLAVERGDRVAILGPNGIGKSTLLKIATGRLEADRGKIAWGYETYPGYFAQDHRDLVGNGRQTIQAWLWDACPVEPIGYVRGKLGMVLFSGDEAEKKVGNLSGGEAARLVFARLGVEAPNVLVLDEPTNHLDMEAIEALVEGLRKYDGTLLLVSHDRWFVSQLASRILEISPKGIVDFRGTYEEYVERCGDDHLDADQAILKAQREKKKAKAAGRVRDEDARAASRRRKDLERRRDEITREIETAEARIAVINELFCDAGYFGRTAPAEVKKREAEQKKARERIDALMAEWEGIEAELGELVLVG